MDKGSALQSKRYSRLPNLLLRCRNDGMVKVCPSYSKDRELVF